MYPLTLLCPFNIWMDSRQSRYTKIQVHTAVTNNTQYNIHTQSELMRTSQTNICWTHISFIFSSNLSICFIRFYLSVASFCHFSCCCPLWFGTFDARPARTLIFLPTKCVFRTNVKYYDIQWLLGSGQKGFRARLLWLAVPLDSIQLQLMW